MARLTPQWLQAGNYAGAQDRRLIGALWPAGGVTGCAVTPATGMSVNIAPGQVAVPSQNSTGSTLCTSTAVETLTLDPAPPSGTNRWDLIICRPRSAELDGGANEDFIFDIVKGAQSAPPAVVPPTPAGTLILAQVGVVGGTSTIPPANITDLRGAGLAVPSPPTPGLRYRFARFTGTGTGTGQITVQIPPGTESVDCTWRARRVDTVQPTTMDPFYLRPNSDSGANTSQTSQEIGPTHATPVYSPSQGGLNIGYTRGDYLMSGHFTLNHIKGLLVASPTHLYLAESVVCGVNASPAWAGGAGWGRQWVAGQHWLAADLTNLWVTTPRNLAFTTDTIFEFFAVPT